MNINTGSIALTGAVLMGGFITTYLWKALTKDQLQNANDQSYFPNRRQISTFTKFISIEKKHFN